MGAKSDGEDQEGVKGSGKGWKGAKEGCQGGGMRRGRWSV